MHMIEPPDGVIGGFVASGLPCMDILFIFVGKRLRPVALRRHGECGFELHGV